MKQNYASAILIAYRLYRRFIGDIDFNEFETLVSGDYACLMSKIDSDIKKCENDKEVIK